MVMSEHEAKIEGLARFVLKMRTKEERRKWLQGFEDKNGLDVTLELKSRILSTNPRSAMFSTCAGLGRPLVSHLVCLPC